MKKTFSSKTSFGSIAATLVRSDGRCPAGERPMSWRMVVEVRRQETGGTSTATVQHVPEHRARAVCRTTECPLNVQAPPPAALGVVLVDLNLLDWRGCAVKIEGDGRPLSRSSRRGPLRGPERRVREHESPSRLEVPAAKDP